MKTQNLQVWDLVLASGEFFSESISCFVVCRYAFSVESKRDSLSQ